MPTEQAQPGAGYIAYFELGATGWDDEVSLNLLIASVLDGRLAKSRTTALPGSPTVGDVYIVRSDDGTNPLKIAAYGGAVGSEAWVYITPLEGFVMRVQDESRVWEFDGTIWLPKSFIVREKTTTTEVLELEDINAAVEMNNGSANTFTIQPDATLDLPVGETLTNIIQTGAGVTTVQAGTGVDLNGVTAGSADINAQWNGVSLYKDGANSYRLQGGHGGVS